MSRTPKVKKTQLNVPPAGRNYVAQSDAQNFPYAEKKEWEGYIADTPPVKNEIVTEGVSKIVDPQAQKQLDLNPFAPTNREFEPVTMGLGGKPKQMDTTRELIVEMYALTGDINLARLLR
jgi:hypothetical protein